MRKTLTIFTLAIFVFSLGFVIAANDSPLRDGTGPMHDEIVAAGGQNGTMGFEEPMLISSLNGQRKMAREGTYRNFEGKEITVQRIQNKYRIQSANQSADCLEDCNLTQEIFQNRTRLYKKLSNGRNAEIKVMPDTASEKALERLRLKVCNEANNCTIELKEVRKGNETKMAYELKRERKAKFFGFIGTKMGVRAQVDAENGEIIKTRKPWWAFLASEPEELEEAI